MTNPWNLTAREIEVLEVLIEGSQDKQVMRALNVSRTVVARNIARIRNKMGTVSRAKSVALWVEWKTRQECEAKKADEKTRVYIAGPMTNLPLLNFPAFHAEAARLRALGFDVVNPAELNPDGAPWSACMLRDLAALETCDALTLLPGWEASDGAQIECIWARRTGKTILPPGVLA